ncbi:MAG: hypothetical protein BWK79_16115 [Beggiatoa sp. IS2]|nr:MAG: hypothetical protein BWK79_16115 [Beggiatoa sp. IS2]
MSTNPNISLELVQRITDSFGKSVESISHVPAEKIARDAVDEGKIHSQIKLLCDTLGISTSNLAGKKILEVGSGLGIFLAVVRRDYQAETWGLEPSSEGFESSHLLAREILQTYHLNPDIILNAKGESIPFEDDVFDIVFSSTVLEHTENPQQVIREAVRVLKPEGYLQFAFPNYGSFFEGHYVIPWIPYLNHTLAHFWVKLWGRDPAFMHTIQLLNYFKVKNWVSQMDNIRVITFGEEVFRQRMSHLSNMPEWAGLSKLKKWLQLLQKLKLIPLATNLLIRIKSFEPIILTLQKVK